MEEFKLYINGAWTATESGSVRDDLNPADNSVIAKVHMAGPAEVEAAIQAAQTAFPAWAAMLAADREKLLLKAADYMEANTERFAGYLIDESGSCFMKAMDEVGQSVNIIRAAAGECRRVEGGVCPPEADGQVNTYIRKPLGVIGGIAPFNYPLLLALNKVALALAAGNTFILKPASDTPISGLIIAECFHEAGLPAGVLNVVPGSGGVVGDTLVNDPRVKMITFTGSTEVGTRIGRECAARLKRVTLEMGGKNPMIVLKDFDVDRAVSIAAFGAFFHQGQICMCTSRIITEAPSYDALCQKLADKAKGLKMGDPHDQGTIIGPLINDTHYKLVDELISDAVEKGARVLCGGGHQGAFYEATVVADVTPEMRIFHEECFAPVVCVVRAKDAEDALRLCNDNTYGLSSALLTNDMNLALTLAPRMEAGMVHVNDTTVMGSRRAPFGGVKNSGMGREDSHFSIEEFTELQWITYQTKPLFYPTDL